MLEFGDLESILAVNYSEQLALQGEIVKRQIVIFKQHSKVLVHRARQRYYFHGSRPSHLLASKLRSSEHFSDVPAIKSKNGVITCDPAQINNPFWDFYSDLHRSFQKGKCDNFIFFYLS